MKFLVTYNIFGKYEVLVEANNAIEAEEKADEIYQEADFGVMKEIVEGHVYSVKSEKGDVRYEI